MTGFGHQSGPFLGGSANVANLTGPGNLFPRFSEGRFGRLYWYHLNALFDAVEALIRESRGKIQELPQRFQPFIGRITARQENLQWPLGSQLAWDEHYLQDPLDSPNFASPPASGARSSDPNGLNEPFTEPGLQLAPPHGIMLPVRDQDGRRRYVWLPALQAAAATLEGVGFPNGTYTAMTVDDAQVYDELTPVGRWPGLTYPAPAQFGILLFINTDPANVQLIAPEVPQLSSCPSPGAAVASRDAASWMGI
jgi:hypothetical protein